MTTTMQVSPLRTCLVSPPVKARAWSGIGVSIFLCFLAAAGMVRRPFKRWAVVLMALGALLFMLSLVGLLLFIPYYGGSLTPVE